MLRRSARKRKASSLPYSTVVAASRKKPISSAVATTVGSADLVSYPLLYNHVPVYVSSSSPYNSVSVSSSSPYNSVTVSVSSSIGSMGFFCKYHKVTTTCTNHVTSNYRPQY